VSEAREHVARAVEAGLVPQVGKARVDNYIFGIKETRHLLTTCFCCDCCCITQYERHFPVHKLDEMFPSLDGFHLEVGPGCNGCRGREESCADRCYISAIEMRGGRAVITDRCRGCGRCAVFCPNGAVKVSIDDPAFLEESYSRIRAHVKHD
jgi:UDP-glucose 4-epimerase